MIRDQLDVNGDEFTVRSARRDDLATIVALLTDDVLGRGRESATGELERYARAFDLIESHPNQELVVVERNGEIVATFDLAILASLSRKGTLRMQIEAVRVATSERGTGLGGAAFQWVIEHARREGCELVQLTTDRERPDAHRFYDRLGFVPSHIGYKLDLA